MSKIIIRKDLEMPEVKRGRSRTVEYPFANIKANSKESFFVPSMGRKLSGVRASIAMAFRRDGLNKSHALVTDTTTQEIEGKTYDGIRVWKVSKAVADSRNPFKRGAKQADESPADEM